MTYSQSSLRIGDAIPPTHTLDVIGQGLFSGTVLAGGVGPAIACTTPVPGDMISAQGASVGDRYGVGTYGDGRMRMFTSKTLSGAGLAFSLASTDSSGPTGTFTDLFSLNASSASCAVPLAVTGGVTASGPISASSISSSGPLSAPSLAVSGALSANSFSCSGNITSGGTVQGQTLTSTGALNVGTTATVTGALTSASVTSSGTVQGGTLASTGALTVATTATITGATTMNGGANITGPTSVTGSLTASGAVQSATLAVSGNSTIGGTETVTGMMTMSGGGAVTGNLSVSGTATAASLSSTGPLSVAGPATLVGLATLRAGANVTGGVSASGTVTGGALVSNSTLNVAGASTLSGPVGVTGNVTASGTVQGAVLTSTGALNVGTTATISGLATIGGGANVTGAVTASGTVQGGALTSTGALAVATTATVQGATTLNGGASVTGNVTASGIVQGTTLSSTAGTNVGGALTVGTTATVTGLLTMSGGGAVTGNLIASGNLSSATLTTSGLATLSGGATVTGGVTASGTVQGGTLASTGQLTVGGAATLSGGLTEQGPAVFNGVTTHTTNLFVQGGSSGGAGPRLELVAAGASGSSTGMDLSTFAFGSSQAPGWSLTATDAGTFTDSLDLLQCTGAGTTQANRLHVNASNGYIGLGGQISPASTLDVTGTGNFSGLLTAGSCTVAGTLTSNGLAVLKSGATVTGGVTASGAVQGATLASTGALTVGGLATVTGLATLSGGLNVTGAIAATTSITAGTVGYFPQLMVGGSTDTVSTRAISALNASLATGASTYITLGQAATTNNQAEITFMYNGSGSSSNTLGLGFFGSATTNRLWYNAAGLLGIGLQTPSYALDALCPSTTGGMCVARFGSNTFGVSLTQNYPQVCLNTYFNGTSNLTMATGWSSYVDLTPSTGFVTLRTSQASTAAGAVASYNPAMVIDPSGKVGIFKTPTSALDVAGGIKSSTDCILNTAAVGALGLGPAAAFGYSGLPSYGFGLSQTSSGQTAVNCIAGQGVVFKDSNVTGMTYSNAGLRIGDANPPTATLDIQGSIRIGGNCALDRHHDPMDIGTVLQYTFRTGSGSVVYDLSPSGINSTLSGTYAWSNSNPYDGLRGAYIAFNDASGVLIPGASVGSTAMTASCWYQPSALSNSGLFNVLFCNGANRNLLCISGATSTIGVYNNGFVDSGFKIAMGSWYNLTVTAYVASGTQTFAVYVNGKLVQTTTNTFSPATYPFTAIGNVAGGGQAAQGKLEDVRVWNRALSTAEAVKLYSNKQFGIYRDLNTGYCGINLPMDGTGVPQYPLDVSGGFRASVQVWSMWSLSSSYGLASNTATVLNTSNWSLVNGSFVGTSAGACLDSNGRLTFPITGLYTISFQGRFGAAASNQDNALWFNPYTWTNVGFSGNSNTSTARIGITESLGMLGGTATYTGMFTAGDKMWPCAYAQSSTSITPTSTTGSTMLGMTLIYACN